MKLLFFLNKNCTLIYTVLNSLSKVKAVKKLMIKVCILTKLNNFIIKKVYDEFLIKKNTYTLKQTERNIEKVQSIWK